MYFDEFTNNNLLYYPFLFLFYLSEDTLSSLNASEYEAVERVKDQFTSKKELQNFIHGLRF